MRDYEVLPVMHEPMVQWSMTMLMSSRLAGRRRDASMPDAVAPYAKRMNLHGGHLPALDTDAITTVLANAAAAPANPGATTITLWCMGGAISEDTAEDAMAFSREGAAWLWEAVSMWDTSETLCTSSERRRWPRRCALTH